jgi:trimethylamine:corrinoid methyltransferase-like protein
MEDENGTKNEGMSEPEMLKMDQVSRAVLKEIGTLADNEAALDLFNQAGAHVDPKKKLVKIPDHIINRDKADAAKYQKALYRRSTKRCEF